MGLLLVTHFLWMSLGFLERETQKGVGCYQNCYPSPDLAVNFALGGVRSELALCCLLGTGY